MNCSISPLTNLMLAAFVLVLCVQCSNDPDYSKTRKIPPKKILMPTTATTEDALNTYQTHFRNTKRDVYFDEWRYDAEQNNLICTKKDNPIAYMEAINHRLCLAFDDFPAKENPKTLQYQAVSPLANLDETALYSSQLSLNGVPFNGVLVGIHKTTGETLLEAQFYHGTRVGMFKVWTSLGRQVTKSFEKNNDLIINVEAVRKPVIYLYPEQAQTVRVRLDFNGQLTHTYPKYPAKTGWEVVAQPDGMLQDVQTGKQYSYLFWEGASNHQYQLDEGFVVAAEDVADFLDEKLAILGLNRREATDFVSYWLPELERNPYNLIHFSTEEYQAQAGLDIHPAPTTLIRVYMVYQALETPIAIPAQQLTPTVRKGFTVVEWGGQRANTTVIN